MRGGFFNSDDFGKCHLQTLIPMVADRHLFENPLNRAKILD